MPVDRRARPRPTRASKARAGSRKCGSRLASRQKRNECPACACTASATLSSTLRSEKKRRDLERTRQTERAAAVHRQLGDVLAGEHDMTGIGRELSAELGDQRGLAGAVRSITACSSPASTLSTRSSVATNALKTLGQVADLQQRPRSCPLLCAQLGEQAHDSAARERTTRSQQRAMIICQYSEARAAVSPKNGVPSNLMTTGSASSSSSNATAPIERAYRGRHTASTTMMMRSARARPIQYPGTDEVGVIGSSAPASPHSVPAMTKHTIL